jgi:hypothetical protein
VLSTVDAQNLKFNLPGPSTTLARIEAGRVEVLLEMMGTAVLVTLRRSALSPAE